MKRKKFINHLPLQLAFQATTTNDVVRYTFTNRVKINYAAIRSIPTNALIFIWSDELGSSLSNLSGIKGVNLLSATGLAGSPSGITVYNAVLLTAVNPEIIFKSPWVVRNLYVRTSVIGTLYVNITYDPFE